MEQVASSPELSLGSRRRSILTCIGLAVLVLLVYTPVLQFQFVNFDDDVHVSENSHVTSGLTLSNLAWDFTIHGPSQWHPLAWMSHQLDCTLFGLSPGGHHATSVLLHLITVCLLFLTLQRMLNQWGGAAFVAAAFAVHPLNVESVAWVSERRNVLCGVFSIATMGLYQAYARRPTVLKYCLVLMGHTAALMSKPLAVTLPCVLFLLDYWPLQRSSVPPIRRVLEKLPLLGFSLASAVLTIECQRAVGTVASLESIPLLLRMMNAVAAYGWYLQKLFLPTGLAAFYPHPALVDPQPWAALAGPAVVFGITLIGISAFCWSIRKSIPGAVIGWLWFLGVMVPMIGIMQVGEQQQADRYAYLPLIGLFLMLSSLASRYMIGAPQAAGVVKYLSGLLICGWTMLAAQQVQVWRDSISLFSHANQVTRRNHWACNNLGIAFLKQGKVLAAADQFKLAIQFVPRYGLAHYNLGVAWFELGHRAAAQAEFETALSLNPSLPEAHQRLGALLAEAGDLLTAETHFREAVRLVPNDALALFNLILILKQTDQRIEAAKLLDAFLQRFPNSANLRTLHDRP